MAVGIKVGFVGTGQMATALARGWIKAGVTSVAEVLGADVSGSAREVFRQATGSAVTASNSEAASWADALVIAVKPGLVDSVLREIAPRISPGALVISVAAGVPLARLESGLPAGARVVRVMPNTPALVGAGATAYALGTTATVEDASRVQELFSAVGLAFEVPEPLLDGVTGLSGSGPAYACLMIEALSDGGVAEGLPRDVATRLAAQTLMGTAKLLLETGRHPAVLKEQVTSPGGTTIEALRELEGGGVRAALMAAVRASAAKARRLATG